MPRGRKPPPQTPQEKAAARRAVDERIDAIVALMERGQWRAGVSHAELAARFAVSVDTIYEDARAAGAVMRRLLAMTAEEKEAARAQLLADLEEHRSIALRTTKPIVLKRPHRPDRTKFYPHPNLSAANETLEQRAKVLGLNAPLQVEVNTPPPELARMTLDELRKLAREVEKRLGVVRARIGELENPARS